MRTHVIGLSALLAAVAVSTVPAGAQSFRGTGGPISGVPDTSGVRIHRGDDRDGWRDRRDRRDRRGPGPRVGLIVRDYYDGGQWALYNNRSWESDSYNDWWHNRPGRAFPRWMQQNRNCERMWWSGGGWTC